MKKPDVSERYIEEYAHDKICSENAPPKWMRLFGVDGHDWGWMFGGAAIIQPTEHLYGHATGRQFREATCLNCEQKNVSWGRYY